MNSDVEEFKFEMNAVSTKQVHTQVEVDDSDEDPIIRNKEYYILYPHLY